MQSLCGIFQQRLEKITGEKEFRQINNRVRPETSEQYSSNHKAVKDDFLGSVSPEPSSEKRQKWIEWFLTLHSLVCWGGGEGKRGNDRFAISNKILLTLCTFLHMVAIVKPSWKGHARGYHKPTPSLLFPVTFLRSEYKIGRKKLSAADEERGKKLQRENAGGKVGHVLLQEQCAWRRTGRGKGEVGWSWARGRKESRLHLCVMHCVPLYSSRWGGNITPCRELSTASNGNLCVGEKSPISISGRCGCCATSRPPIDG